MTRSLASVLRAAGLVVGMAGLDMGVPAALGQTVELRIVERTGQAVVTSGGDAVLDFAVQAKVTGGAGGAGNGAALGGFGFNIVMTGEPDSYGTLQRGLISNSDRTYATGIGLSAVVGSGGLPAQYTYLANLAATFNGIINLSGGIFTNTPGSQEIGLVTGSTLGQSLLSTPGMDPQGEGNPETWTGYGTGGSPTEGSTAALDPAIGVEYFGQGEFIDVYRFRYTVSNFTGRHVTVTLAGPNVQTFTQLVFSNGAWGSDAHTNTSFTVTGMTIQVGTPGACCNAAGGDCLAALQTECISGMFTDGAACSPNPCPQPLGQCCSTSGGGCTSTTLSGCPSGTGEFSWSLTCCNTATGACAVVTGQAGCDAGNAWNSAAACSPNPCPQPTTGACCNPGTGACTIVAQSDCTGGLNWVGGGAGACAPNPCPQPPPPEGACCDASVSGCMVTLQTDCAAGLAWHSGLTCGTSACPQQTGSCCDPASGACASRTQASCATGSAWTALQSCSPNPCQLVTGACCNPSNGTCASRTQSACGTAPWSIGLSCSPNPCPQPNGACCDASSAACTITLQASCTTGFSWYIGLACDPSPCTLPTGSCCDSTGGCTVQLQIACTGGGGGGGSSGGWTSGGTCTPNPCNPSGRCCSGFNGACSVQLQNSCPQSGTWLAGASCSPNPCPAVDGHCCNIVNTVCFVSRLSACSGANLAWSAGASCSPNPCLVLGRCCNFVNGVCWMLPRASCGSGAHTWAVGGACSPNPCPPAAACCDGRAGVCLRRTQSSCVSIGGTWIVGATCTPTPCVEPDLGKCCNIITGNCTLTRQDACGINAHTWAVADTCSPNPCEQPGACCRPNGTCRRTLAVNCVLWQGTWSAGACVPNPCTTLFAAAVRVCRGDFDGSGTLDGNDITTFAAAWLSKDTSADFDGSGSLDTEDLFAFLSAWFAGCP